MNAITQWVGLGDWTPESALAVGLLFLAGSFLCALAAVVLKSAVAERNHRAVQVALALKDREVFERMNMQSARLIALPTRGSVVPQTGGDVARSLPGAFGDDGGGARDRNAGGGR